MSEQQVTEQQNTITAEADEAFDSALSDIADKFSEPETDDEGSEESTPEDAAASEEQPDEAVDGANASAPSGDGFTLEDGTVLTAAQIKEMREREALFGTNAKTDEWFKNYQRKNAEVDRKLKDWETQSAPVRQKAQLFEQLDQQFTADPIQYALNSVALGVRQGLVDPQVYQALAETVQGAQQQGAYDPHSLRANAASMQAQRTTEQYEQQQRFHQAQTQVYDLERSLGRFLNETERTELARLIDRVAVQEGRVLPLQEAWSRYQQLVPPPKPMAQKSPAKVVQQIKNQKPTTERASGRSTGGGKYNKADLDKDLEFIQKSL